MSTAIPVIDKVSQKNNVFSDIPCAAAVFSYDRSYVRLDWANDRFFTLFGCRKSDYLEMDPNDCGFRLLGREYSQALIEKVRAILKNCSDFEIEVQASRIDGSFLPLRVRAGSVKVGSGYSFNCLLENALDLYSDEIKDADMTDMMMSIMSVSADYIFRYDSATDTLNALRNAGGSFISVLSVTDFEQYFRDEGRVYEEDLETYEQMCSNIKSGIDTGIFELRLRFTSGDFRWYRITVKTTRDKLENSLTGAVGRVEDISTLKNANQRLIEKAERDPLTKLYNKTATKNLIQNCLRTDSRDTYDAFIIVDVDNFKQVNDTLGHLFGDSVLTDLAAEMQDLFRTNDIIGRIGGDEFIVFLRGLHHKSHIAAKADDLCKVFSLIYESEDEGLKISGSLGIALFPTDGDSFDELYKKADIALYTSKRAGKSCYTFYQNGATVPQDEKPTPRIERYQTNMDFLAISSVAGGDILQTAFEMAENGSDMNEAINIIISKVGKRFGIDRIAVSECGTDMKVFKDTYIWRSKDAEPTRSDTIRFSKKEMNDLCSCFDKNLIFSVNAEETARLRDNAFVTYLRVNKIKNAVVCGYFRAGRLNGIISFQSTATSYICSIEEAQALKDLARTVFSYLIKLRDFDKAREAADYSANYDSLTGLMNYDSFKNHIIKYMDTVFENDKYIFLMADFSNFSYINSRFGFEAGNELLKSFSAAFNYFSDKVKYACRVAADRFCVFAEYEPSIVSTFENFTRRFVTNEKLAGGNTSFGIVTGAYVLDMVSLFDYDKAFDNVNLALRYSKAHMIGKCSIYKEEMREELNRSIEIADDARRGLLNNEFKVYFQPKVSVSKNEIVGAEALVRWIKPDGSVVTPDSFVPFLEKNGYIVNIDYFVYDEVCRYIRDRRDAGLRIVPISVNVSRIHMLTHNFVPRLTSIVRKYKVEPSDIELELTESVFLANEDDAINTIDELRKFGFRISIDDFGSGYSSLSLLKRMPVDVLKIDKDFFSGAKMNDKEGIVLSSVIEMANKMDISIICEGVETQEQVDFLRSSHCDTAQGFFFARPIPTGDFEDLLEKGFDIEKFK